MPTTIFVPDGFTYVGGAIISTFWLLFFQLTKVTRARKVAKIEYPAVYAEKADAATRPEAMVFNCTQRTHQNTLEMMPIILTGTVITGLKYPYMAAGLCSLFSLSRVSYTLGYSSGDPKKRLIAGGGLGGIAGFSLLLTSTWTVVE